MSGFSTCDNKGFHINFPNGLTLSTQFGGGNYGSNYNRKIGDRSDHHAETVEIAVFPTHSTEPGSHHWVTQEIASKAGLADPQDSVMGHVGFEDWLRLFDATRAYTREPAQEKS